MRKYIIFISVLIALITPAHADPLAFLTADELPNGINYLPPPPAFMTNGYCLDEQQYMWGKNLRHTPRGDLARMDASVDALYVAKIFSAPFGLEISWQKTPEIYMLMLKTATTSLHATGKTKKYYQRERPFVHYKEHSAIPETDEAYRHSGSYPSAHSSLGWGVALVLSEVNPAKQEELLKLGYEYGQSRVITGYHYQSDVDAARLAASAAVARLHTDTEFLRQLQAAKEEFHKIQNK